MAPRPYWDHPYVIPAAGVIWKALVEAGTHAVPVAEVDAALRAKEAEIGRPCLRYKGHAVKYLRHKYNVPIHCRPALGNTVYRLADDADVAEDHRRTTEGDYSESVSKFRGYHDLHSAATGPLLELSLALGNKLGLTAARMLEDLGLFDPEPPLPFAASNGGGLA
jgi:hypothetical protein